MRRVGVLLTSLALSLISSTQVFADNSVQDFQSRILERFDVDGPKDENDLENHRWIVRGSKFSTPSFPVSTLVATYPKSLFRAPKEGEELKAFGVRGAFDRSGYNYIDIIPVSKDKKKVKSADGTEKEVDDPEGIPIPGRVSKIDMWIWGSGYDYYVTMDLMDHKGVVHTVMVGDINHQGWKNFSVDVPKNISQEKKYLPNIEQLSLVKLTIWTRPGEKTVWTEDGTGKQLKAGETSSGAMNKDARNIGGFFVYFDHIKATTDVHENPYDGEDLASPDEVTKLWGDKDTTKTTNGSVPQQ